MFGLPMDLGGPIIGFGVCILFIVAGIVVVRRLAPRPLKGEDRQLLEDLQVRLGELDEMKQRIGELEERVDFAERVVVKHREAERPRPPSSPS